MTQKLIFYQKGLVRQNFAGGHIRMNQCKRTRDLSRRNPMSKCHFCQKMSHDLDQFTTTDIFPDANNPLTDVSVTALTGDPESLGKVNVTVVPGQSGNDDTVIITDPAGQERVFIFLLTLRRSSHLTILHRLPSRLDSTNKSAYKV